MKIKSGNILTKIPFIAVDETDLLTRLTGLSTFTAYRARNGEVPVEMLTPTVNEADSGNMPGIYWLLVDEDTTLEAGVDEHTMVLNVTHPGMYPVSLAVEITKNLRAEVENVQGRLPDALDNGFLKASTKRIALTTLGASGAGGQKYGG